MELLIGGVASCMACIMTNPLEVVKTRVQLQGELESKDVARIKYRNVFHAFHSIVKEEGFMALQKGLVPSCCYQFFTNAFRLGIYQCLENLQFTMNEDGKLKFGKTVIASSVASVVGAVTGSPFYLVKTQLQSMSTAIDAVGHQHEHRSMTSAFSKILRTEGFWGLWRGTASSVLRVTVAGTVHLTTFAGMRQFFGNYKISPENSWQNVVLAATVSAFTVTAARNPVDVIATRIYNQPTDEVTKKGIIYKSISDCAIKIYKTEGFPGFYKGWFASLLKVAPQSVLSLYFWEELKKLHKRNEKR